MLAVHPSLRLDLWQPIGRCWDAAQIFLHVLFPYVPDGDLPTLAIGDGYSEHLLRQEESLNSCRAKDYAEPMAKGASLFAM